MAKELRKMKSEKIIKIDEVRSKLSELDKQFVELEFQRKVIFEQRKKINEVRGTVPKPLNQ